MSELTRRHFLAATAVTAASRLLSPSLARALSTLAPTDAPLQPQRLTDGWEFFRGPLGSPWEVWHSQELAVFTPVAMPHCFNAYDACDPDVSYYRGQGWYRTWIQPSNPFPSGRTLLHFWGAGQVTTVFLGETKIGEHKGGYDEFVFDITDAITDALAATKPDKRGTPLAVLCDNSRRMDTMPSDLSDFSLYGGLYRHVELVYVPAVALEAVHITAQDTNTSQPKAIVSARLYAPAHANASCTAAISITDPNNKIIHQSQHTLNVSQQETELNTVDLPNPLLWSPAHPHLYTCTVTLSSDAGTSSTTERFGLRHTEFVEHGPFKLNGERLLLRGTHRHEDHAGCAAAVPDDVVRKEMQLIKAMGANFIRLAHYQQSRLVLELCDELGLCVWEEVPWCRGGIGDAAWQQMGRDKLTAMIDQHRNHPSIILWGLGNEDDWPTEYPSVNQTAIRAYMTELRDLAHSLDPTRLTSFRRCDFARDIPDVYSPSIWAGWYRGLYTEYESELKKQSARVPRFIHIEWGADSHARRHSETPDKVESEIATGTGADERGLDYLPTGGIPRVSVDGDWSETYACNLFDWHLKVQEAQPWLTGAAQWIFKDFTTPLRVENPLPRINQKGVAQRDLTLKESYFVFQSFWADGPEHAPMLHIYGHTWPIRWGKPGEQKLLKVYSNCDQVELFLNNKSLGSKRRNSQDFPAAGLRWTTPLPAGDVHLRAVGHRSGPKGSKTVTDEISFRYETRPWGKPARLQLTELSRKDNLITLEALLVDEAGLPCLDARNVVRFSIAGDAHLLDNLGTVGGSRVVQLANGRAWITLRLHSNATAGVTTQGLPSALLNLAPTAKIRT
ncbi:MAG TPA: glycoside hydrolase family 2 TIM barrel-domain containing protein [Acidobacteriaceae bacterium]|nr:glycoside hydrolase family 2 TIM barrel-domain containing protein [Acidobacteriaceae bacterium]